MMTKQEILSSLRNGLIVSCQVKKEDPQYQDHCIEALAKAAIWGGADGLRINEPQNIAAVRDITELPIIGLKKIFRSDTEVFMTPDMESVEECLRAGADIIAVDGTPRPIDGRKGNAIISEVKRKYPNVLILADVRDEKDAVEALELGADIVAPTFYRFSPNAKTTEAVDWKMVTRLLETCKGKAAVFMEGKIWTPDEAIKALYYGCHAVVVGSAITRPQLITRRFKDTLTGFNKDRSLYY